MNKTQLQIGINLGGWLSQYQQYDHAHFQSFITAADIRRIAEWGFDHIRLPVDYPVLEDDAHPGEYLESGFGYLDDCISWCADNHLRVVLDLHKAPGYAFHSLDKVSLFDDPAMQSRLINLWAEIARRYGKYTDSVAFELLNEMVLPESAPWNALYPRIVAKIREIAPHSLIVIGGNYYNAADQLQYLDLLPDENIYYTFHFYLPMVVTHYRASWVPWLVDYGEVVAYPGDSIVPDADFLQKHAQQSNHPELAPALRFDRAYLEEKLKPAIDFSRQHNQPLYCGEFGVIDIAPLENRLNWMRDFVSLLREYNMGRALWSYKAMDFGLVDKDGNVISEELVRIAAEK